MAPGWRYRQHKCERDGCAKMATVGAFCVEHAFEAGRETKETVSVKIYHPCHCTNPRQTCSTCRADMALRNPASYPCAENVAAYGAPSIQTEC